MSKKPSLTSKEISDLLKTIKTKEAKLVTCSITTLGDNPIGFLGSHYRLLVKYITSDKEEETLSFFLKTTPSVDEHQKYVSDIGVFQKETLLFKSLIPELLKSTAFLTDPWTSKCYLVKENLLLFDDLSLKNYRLADGREIFDLDHCIAALKTLADFHSSTIIWEENNKKYSTSYKLNDLYTEGIQENCYVFEEGHSRARWFSSVVSACVHLCKLIGRESECHRIPGIIRRAVSDVGASCKWRNVFSHGDLWSNNFMFNYNGDGTIRHCVLVDFQLARYAPVTLDLMCCIHLTCPLNIRKDHMENLIKVYYKKLSDNLAKVNLNIHNILSMKELEEGCEKYKLTGLSEALLYGCTIWIPADLSAGLLRDPARLMENTFGDRSAVIEQAFSEDYFFKEQMSDLMNELLECADKC